MLFSESFFFNPDYAIGFVMRGKKAKKKRAFSDFGTEA